MKLVTCGAAQQIRPPLKAADHADVNGVGHGDLGQGLARGTPLERKTPKFTNFPILDPRDGRWERFAALDRWEFMDKQTKREVWLLAIGTALVEIPIAFAAFTILSH
jgi:hypothetical protein